MVSLYCTTLAGCHLFPDEGPLVRWMIADVEESVKQYAIVGHYIVFANLTVLNSFKITCGSVSTHTSNAQPIFRSATGIV